MVTKEEDNFLRIVHLNFGVGTTALRRYFDNVHPNLPADLSSPSNKSILANLHKPRTGQRRVLYQEQWNSLYPSPGSPVVSSADLDVTLMVCLLRNLQPNVSPPSSGFDALPQSNDSSDGANIARIKYYKNFIVSHSKDGKLSDTDFERIWIDLEMAIRGLGNQQDVTDTADAKYKCLDYNTLKILVSVDGRLNEQSNQVAVLSSQVTKLEINIDNINVRMAEIAQFKHVAPENAIRVVLIGKTGVGKSRTGNSIIGENKLQFSYGRVDSVTQCCSLTTAERFGRRLDVVDTPGLFDTKKSSINVPKEIIRCMAMTSPGPHALLFCVKIERCSYEDLYTLNHFMKYFGEDILKYTIVVFTHVDRWEMDVEDQGREPITRQQYVDNLYQPLKNLLALCENRYLFVNNRLRGHENEDMVKEILEKIETLISSNNKKCYANSEYQMVEEALEEEIRRSHKPRQELKTGSQFYEKISKRIKSKIHAKNIF